MRFFPFDVAGMLAGSSPAATSGGSTRGNFGNAVSGRGGFVAVPFGRAFADDLTGAFAAPPERAFAGLLFDSVLTGMVANRCGVLRVREAGVLWSPVDMRLN